jgi:hypothetical protein
MGRYTQQTSLRYESDPATVWPVLLATVEALYRIRPGASAYDRRQVAFSTGMTGSSWGEYVTATVEWSGSYAAPDAAERDRSERDGTVVRLRGKPRNLFLVSRWGERLHLREISKRIDGRIRTGLGLERGRRVVTRTLHVGGDVDSVWPALVSAIDDADCVQLGAVDDTVRRVAFSTGMTLTSWGQDVTATVNAAPDGGVDIELRGDPTYLSGTTRFGERTHLATVARRLRRAISSAGR